MGEIYRVLEPGGQFVLVAEVYKIRYHMKRYNDAEQTRALLEDSGFRDVALYVNPKQTMMGDVSPKRLPKHICVTGYKA